MPLTDDQRMCEDLVRSSPDFMYVVSSNGRIMPGGGAVPIIEGGSVVGAIAVSGGTDEQDQKCAEVAMSGYTNG